MDAKRITSYSASLEQLESYFKWYKDVQWTEKDLWRIAHNIEADLDLFSPLLVPNYTILSYIYFKLSGFLQNSAYKGKAFDYILMAEQTNLEPAQNHVIRCHFVVKATKVTMKFEQENKVSSYQLPELDQSEEEISLCLGLSAHAIGQLGCPHYQEALDKLYEAFRLNEHPVWSYLIALYKGRMRRERKGCIERIKVEEIKKWRYACEQTNFEEARYIAGLADAVMCFSISRNKLENRNTERDKEQCLRYVEKCLDIAGNDHDVFWNCAKIYKTLKMHEEFEKCIQIGISRCQRNYKLLHKYASYLWRIKNNLSLAKEYLEKALEGGETTHRVFWVEHDLLKIKMEMNADYNPQDDFVRLRTQYCNERDTENFKIYLNALEGNWLMNGIKDEDKHIAGLERLLDAIQLEYQHKRHGGLLSSKDNVESQLKRSAKERPNFVNLYNLAYFYKNLRPCGITDANLAIPPLKKILETNIAKEEQKEVVIKDLCNVFITFNKFDKALQEARCLSNAKVRYEIEAKSYMGKGKQDDLLPSEKLKFYKLALGNKCKDAVACSWALLISESPINRISKKYYDLLALMLQTSQDPHAFFITKSKFELEEYNAILKNLDFKVSDLLCNNATHTNQLREKRLQFSLKIDIHSATEVLREARFVLDRIHKQFTEYFRNDHSTTRQRNNPVCYFPLIKPNHEDQQTAKDEFLKLVTSSKKQHGSLINLHQVHHKRFASMVDKIGTKQFEYQDIITTFTNLVNIDKHERLLVKEDFPEGGMKTACHRAADFAEHIVQEYEKHIPSAPESKGASSM